MRLPTLLRLAVLIVFSGCITAKAPSGSQKRGSETVLTQEQLMGTNSSNLFDAMIKLRPEWFTSRGSNSATDMSESTVSVFMGGSYLGKASSMRDMRVLDINGATFWNAGQASAKFGMGHPRGVIELTRK